MAWQPEIEVLQVRGIGISAHRHHCRSNCWIDGRYEERVSNSLHCAHYNYRFVSLADMFHCYRGGGGSSDEADNTSNEPDPVFPAGSYAFETTLQKTSTSCTSRSSTWRCYPYSQNSNATFFWIIDEDEDKKGKFSVSSSENPFAPSFSNLTASVLDRDGTNERMVFEFDMAKTVVPEDALTPDNRAAKCTFSGTRFQATMWTKRGSTKEAGDVDTSKRFGAWPGDVEIIQSKKSELGQPECEDDDGNAIADVQASSGECSCDYANFEMD